jgi:hypothetical protein
MIITRIRCFGFSIIIFAGYFITSSLPLFCQPKISFDKTSRDVGNIYSGEIKKIQWTIKNDGRDTLIISNVHPSCGCTSVKNPKSSLAPGESDTLEVEFNSAGYKGKIAKQIDIASNDPLNTNTNLTFTGEVISELELINNVRLLWFQAAPIGKETRQSVSFKNSTNKTITITGYKSSGADVHAVLQKATVMPFDTITFPITVLASKEGFNEEKLSFETDNKNQPHVQLSVGYMGVKEK